MGQLVMSFRGLCMHVTEGLPEGIPYRVVAIDASTGFQGANLSPQSGKLDLPAHQCYLETTKDVITSTGWSVVTTLGSTKGVPFNGYLLTVVNPDTTQTLKVALTDLTSLTTVVPGMLLLPSIQSETGAPSQAACYVDIRYGTITASQFALGGFYTTWTIPTVVTSESPNGDPILQLTWLDGTTQQVVIPSTPIPVPPLSDGVPGSIVLHNSTTNHTDGPLDFALYFLASTNGIPSPLPTNLPGEGGGSVNLSRAGSGTGTDMTPSCSNSRYP